MVKEVLAQQLPLGIGLRDDCLLDTYYPGDNQQALSHIKQMAQGIGERFIYVWGRSGVGRTHLLQGACHWANRCNHSAVYLSLLTAMQNSTAVFDGLERVDLICVDDIQALAGNAKWEEAFFHFFNRIRSAEHARLLVAGNMAPKALGIQLADLQSRLTWGVTYALHALDDEQLVEALQLRAKQRGFELSPEVGYYLINRYTRSMPELYALLDKLDKASLAAQRRITIPFVKSVLK